jgi:hypothetical protein
MIDKGTVEKDRQLKAQRIGMKIISCMIQCHNDHYNTPQKIN